MKTLFQPFLLLLAKATDRELARHVEFLKVENEILRSRLPERLRITPQEKQRLLKFGRKLGKAIHQLVTIVSPRTFLPWLSEDKPPRNRTENTGPGRPRTNQDIRELVLRIANDTGWGYTRIHGELKKLGITGISRSTIVNILKEEGIDPGPVRDRGTWSEFVRRHAETLWACDFFQKKIRTSRGFVDYFLLFFIHILAHAVFSWPGSLPIPTSAGSPSRPATWP